MKDSGVCLSVHVLVNVHCTEYREEISYRFTSNRDLSDAPLCELYYATTLVNETGY